MQTNRILPFLFSLLFLFITGETFAQLSSPSGALNSNSSGSGIGISNTSPKAQLDIHYLQNSNSGLLHLLARKKETGVVGGGTQIFVPDYAFRLDYQFESEPSINVFQIGSAGHLEVGNLSGLSLNTFSSFKNDLGIYSEQGNLKLLATGEVEWSGDNSFLISQYNAVLPLLELSTEGTLLIRNNANSFSYGDGAVYGLKIENAASAGHNYAIEITTAHGKIFDISNSGHMHLGPNLNFDIPNSENYRLYVEDGIRTERVRVDIADVNGWADYVFYPDYDLMSIEELAEFIEMNGHLPGVPTAEEVCQNGIDLAEMNKILLEKIEELSLMVIDLNDKVKTFSGTSALD